MAHGSTVEPTPEPRSSNAPPETNELGGSAVISPLADLILTVIVTTSVLVLTGIVLV